MKKIALAGMLAAIAGAQVGCATIFTGTSDKVLIDCEPEGATCAVIGGGGIGGFLVTASQANVAMRAVLGMIEPHVSPESRETLRKVDFNELVAALVQVRHLNRVPPDLAAAAAILQKLPKGLIGDILENLGIREVGVSPFSATLKKGKAWGVLCFKDGYKSRIELIGLRFNTVTIVNALNLFLGCIIDLMTGAMFNLEDRVRIRLHRRE